ncbi:vacuolar protein sorting-associated protein [Planoprotostelium fungivorum]|uniref:Vacuolar protein sorting-associated protein n=1 Tax=Planoprotostelium fungivorum TaxID=1890364 RepID=A0A2P6NPI8_9EUKA|nr:vacuolar protein sorting-associated protein [Planoprotostelium fungivorum]
MQDRKDTESQDEEDLTEDISSDGIDDIGNTSDEGECISQEQDEPKLKYQRLGSHVSDILRKDLARCTVVHQKFLAMGTHSGAIHILDLHGNEVKRFNSHNLPINDLSVDVAGRVVINSLYTDEVIEYSSPKSLFAIALDPEFSKKSNKSFAVGGKRGELIINSQRWFGRRDNIIHSGEGAIYNIKWAGSLIAWCNDAGVKVYDCDTEQRISFIDRPKESPRPDLYKCQLCWESTTRLLIGWADSVKIAQVIERTNDTDDSKKFPDRYIQITSMRVFFPPKPYAHRIRRFQTDYYICGIAPFGEYIITLAYLEDEDNPKLTRGLRPEFRIISRNNKEISSDALTVHGYEQYKSQQYSLGSMSEESMYYVVSPRDIVVARPRDLDDHVAWLMERKKYEAALRVARQSEALLNVHKLVDIAGKYIQELITEKQPEKAAELCSKILQKDPLLWNKWIDVFIREGYLKAVVDFIPVGKPTLDSAVYENILVKFLETPADHGKLLSVVEEWPATVYDPNKILYHLELMEPLSDTLLDVQAKLYTYVKRFDKTMNILLKRKRPNALQYIENYELFEAVRSKVLLLMDYDSKKAVKMLVTHIDQIPVPEVVEQLRPYPLMLHSYLHALFLKDPQVGSTYHELQVGLYAQYDYSYLMTFLKQSDHWALGLENAYQICEERNYYPEMVYILGRMGRVKQALQLLIERIGDVKTAIEFIDTQNDDELWEDLIDYSMKNPKFVSGLLEHIGAYIDPVRLIKRIPMGMEVKNLRDRIVKIISDYHLQMSLREGCNEILKADCVDLIQRLHRSNRRGVRVAQDHRCPICDDNILTQKDVIIFGCRHIYHQSCLRVGEEGKRSSSEVVRCVLCQTQSKRGKTSSYIQVARKIGPNVAT